MVKIEVDGFDALRANWRDFSDRRFMSAVATGLTRTALNAQAQVKAEMGRVFDRPKPWIMNSLWVETATADPSKAGTSHMGSPSGATRAVRSRYMQAMVYFKDELAGGDPRNTANELLKPQVYGGGRNHKRGEELLMKSGVLPQGWHAIPGSGARRDRYGNMPGPEWVRIISAFKGFDLAGSSMNRTTRSATKRKATLKNYFVSHPRDVKKASNGGRLPYGIYERTKAGKILTVLRFRQRVSYRQRLDFFGIVQRTAQMELAGQVRLALMESESRMYAGQRRAA